MQTTGKLNEKFTQKVKIKSSSAHVLAGSESQVSFETVLELHGEKKQRWRVINMRLDLRDWTTNGVTSLC